jgi:F-type H+-transporting ATPase subunit delta
MANETVARRYASAVFSLAKDANAVAAVKHDLHTVVATLDADETIAKFFRSPVVDRKEKTAIIERAFDKLNDVALHTVLLLIRKRREALLKEIVEQFDLLEQQSRGAAPLRIETARELSQSELDAIVSKLGTIYRTAFDVTQSINPNLIGGVRITLGDKRIDGSVSGRLDDLARLLSTN